MRDLDALVMELESGADVEPIALERHGRQVAVIVSSQDYANFIALEEALADKLDIAESEAILKDPKWIGWELAQKQIKP
jgi:PHD/YefM family antitoxin component YafN of YafNO toxin-antitoxin module